MENTPYIQLIQYQLPQVDFKHYKIVKVESEDNQGKSSDIYKKRLFITIQDDSDPPDESWDRYAHWFTQAKYDDRPMRDNAVTLIVKQKRWKNKSTGKTYMSVFEGVKLYPKTERPEDLLEFLKSVNWFW